MIVVGSRGDLARLNGTDPAVARFVADEIVPELEAAADDEGRDWEPGDHGVVLVLERMADLHAPGTPACYGGPGEEEWEYVTYHPGAGAFLAEIGTNQIVGAVIPDAPWLDRGVRARLLEAAGIAADGAGPSQPPAEE